MCRWPTGGHGPKWDHGQCPLQLTVQTHTHQRRTTILPLEFDRGLGGIISSLLSAEC